MSGAAQSQEEVAVAATEYLVRGVGVLALRLWRGSTMQLRHPRRSEYDASTGRCAISVPCGLGRASAESGAWQTDRTQRPP